MEEAALQQAPTVLEFHFNAPLCCFRGEEVIWK